MKILVISHKPPYPPIDGGTLATLNMCLGLAHAGNQVSVLTLSTPKHPGAVKRIPKEILSRINFDIIHIPLITNPTGYMLNFLLSRMPYTIQRYKSTAFKKLIIKTLKAFNFDIVQIEGIYLYPYIKTIRKHFKGKLVYRAHNVEHHIWENLADEENNQLKSRYFGILANRLARIERKLNEMLDALIAISEPDRIWFEKNGFNKPSITIPAGYFPVKPLAADIEPFNQPCICYIGALDWLPNSEGLIWFIDWVWPRIQSAFPNVEFHIAGKNANDKLAERLMIERNIIFHGQVSNSSEFLLKCPVMVVPLFSGSGIRVKIIEGMFLNRAIVATSLAVQGITATHNRHFLIANTPNDFADSVCSLLQSSEKTNLLARNAREFARKEFDAATLAKRLTHFFEQLP